MARPLKNDPLKLLKDKYGDQFDYSLFEYKGSTKNITLVCKKHGKITKTYNSFYRTKYGCTKCGNEESRRNNPNKMSIEDFIKKANERFNNKFNYTKAIYKNCDTPILIKCSFHGDFWQTPYAHLKSVYGCPKCKINLNIENTSSFIKQSKEIHGGIYNYSNTKYIYNNKKVKVICKDHGFFFITPHAHITEKRGCPKCSAISRGSERKKPIELLIKDFRDIHDTTYDYSSIKYKNNITKVDIVCKYHGIFSQAPKEHRKGVGCPKCKQSRGERRIDIWLSKNNLEYKSEEKLANLKYKRKLIFDFYLPNYTLCIEYQGRQHYEPVQFGGMSYDKAVKNFKEQQIKDNIKRRFCYSENIKLIEIPYWDFDNIEEILIKHLDI